MRTNPSGSGRSRPPRTTYVCRKRSSVRQSRGPRPMRSARASAQGFSEMNESAPASRRKPSARSVRIVPPSRGDASRSTTSSRRSPSRASSTRRWAAARPAIPPPTTTIREVRRPRVPLALGELMDGVDQRADVVDRGPGQDTVAEVEDVAGPALGARENHARSPPDLGGRGEERGRVEIPLDADVGAEPPPALSEIDAPVEPDDVPARLAERLEKPGGPGSEVDHRHARRDRLDDRARVRQDERPVVVRAEGADPRVEELDGLGAGGDLPVQVARRGAREERE